MKIDAGGEGKVEREGEDYKEKKGRADYREKMRRWTK